jgi:hypothetical protein
MTLIVAPSEPAESFCSVAAADAYHAARGNAAWAALDTGAKEIALRKATDHISTYSMRWRGDRSNINQALDWPRAGVFVDGFEINYDIVPAPVANACALLALKSIATILTPDVGPQKQSVSVGPISTTYAIGARQAVKFQAVENMLTPYLSGGPGFVKVGRS